MHILTNIDGKLIYSAFKKIQHSKNYYFFLQPRFVVQGQKCHVVEYNSKE